MDYGIPRNWKWLFPALAAVLAYVGGGMAWLLPNYAEYVRAALWLIAAVMSLAALVNLWLYFDQVWSQNYMTRQIARATTPQTKLAEYLQHMHPETVEYLGLRLSEAWLIKAGVKGPEYYLDGPGIKIPYQFVEHVLDRSDNRAMMAKRMLSEGAKTWSREYTDYQLYDALYAWWYSQYKVTAHSGSNPALWIPPWTPDHERAALGIISKEQEQSND